MSHKNNTNYSLQYPIQTKNYFFKICGWNPEKVCWEISSYIIKTAITSYSGKLVFSKLGKVIIDYLKSLQKSLKNTWERFYFEQSCGL